MLVGNKADKDLEDNVREVKTNEALEFSQKNKLLFMETSAKDNVAVSDAFEKLIRGRFRRCWHYWILPGV